MHLTTIDEVKNYGNIFVDNESHIENNEIVKMLDEQLSGEFRSIYLRIKNGSKVNKGDRDKLANKIKEILCPKNEDN